MLSIDTSGNLTANNTAGLNYAQNINSAVDFSSTEVVVASVSNNKPATGYFFICGFVDVAANGNDVILTLYDVTNPSRPNTLAQSGASVDVGRWFSNVRIENP